MTTDEHSDAYYELLIALVKRKAIRVDADGEPIPFTESFAKMIEEMPEKDNRQLWERGL